MGKDKAVGKRGPVPFDTWVQRVAWALRNIDDPLMLSKSPLVDLPAVKALAARRYSHSLVPEAYALQEILQVGVDWALAELRGNGKSKRAAEFLSLYVDNPSVTLVAKEMNLSREHVSRCYRLLALEVGTRAFLKLTQNGDSKYLEEIASKLVDKSHD